MAHVWIAQLNLKRRLNCFGCLQLFCYQFFQLFTLIHAVNYRNRRKSTIFGSELAISSYTYSIKYAIYIYNRIITLFDLSGERYSLWRLNNRSLFQFIFASFSLFQTILSPFRLFYPLSASRLLSAFCRLFHLIRSTPCTFLTNWKHSIGF